MKKLILLLCMTVHGWIAYGQDMGLSFSYFLPRNGSFSIPVSPFSIRGVGLELNRFVSLETGGSLYRMTGLNIIGLPFTSKEPMAGSNLTLMVPAEMVVSFSKKSLRFDFRGGGFGYYGFFQKLNQGVIDRAIREMEQWVVVNSDLSFKSRPGIGWRAGTALHIDVTRQWGLTLEVSYLAGSSFLSLEGSYTGVAKTDAIAAEIINKEVNFDKGKIDYTGLEISVGIFMLGRR